MESVLFTEVAALVTAIGGLGLVVAVINIAALRVVQDVDIPACAVGRIQWWCAHNRTFLIASALTATGGLVLLLL